MFLQQTLEHILNYSWVAYNIKKWRHIKIANFSWADVLWYKNVGLNINIKQRVKLNRIF